MAEELAKRIDLRSDMNQRFDAVDRRFGGTDKPFNDLNQRFTDMQGALRTCMWVVSGWFTFFTAVVAVFEFLRR